MRVILRRLRRGRCRGDGVAIVILGKVFVSLSKIITIEACPSEEVEVVLEARPKPRNSVVANKVAFGGIVNWPRWPREKGVDGKPADVGGGGIRRSLLSGTRIIVAVRRRRHGCKWRCKGAEIRKRVEAHEDGRIPFVA